MKYAKKVITIVVEYSAYMFMLRRYHIALWTYEGWHLNYNKVESLRLTVFSVSWLFSFFKLIVTVFEKMFATKAGKYVAYLVAILNIFCIVWKLRFIG